MKTRVVPVISVERPILRKKLPLARPKVTTRENPGSDGDLSGKIGFHIFAQIRKCKKIDEASTKFSVKIPDKVVPYERYVCGSLTPKSI